MKKFFKWRLKWINTNPLLAAYIAFFKGVIFTVLFYEFILNQRFEKHKASLLWIFWDDYLYVSS